MECQNCCESDDEGNPSTGACHQCIEERDYGGVLGADGRIYSDADPGL